MDWKLKFVARLLDGEQTSSLCQEFGIFRNPGYKIYERYKHSGLEGLTDRTRKPHRYANQLPFQLEREILKVKKEKPSCGAPNIREKILRQYPDVKPLMNLIYSSIKMIVALGSIMRPPISPE